MTAEGSESKRTKAVDSFMIACFGLLGVESFARRCRLHHAARARRKDCGCDSSAARARLLRERCDDAVEECRNGAVHRTAKSANCRVVFASIVDSQRRWTTRNWSLQPCRRLHHLNLECNEHELLPFIEKHRKLLNSATHPHWKERR